MATTRRRPSRLKFVIVPAIIGFAFLIAAGLAYRSQAAQDDALADHGITTTAVISRVFHGQQTFAAVGDNPTYDVFAIAAFTAAGAPAHAQVTLEACTGVCRAYRVGQQLMITYDSRNPALAVAGHPSAPPLHLNYVIVLLAVMGLLFIFGAVFNLLARF